MKLNKNGFTLVEVIVVLVILAILAAILIPSLTGYIDKANEKVSIAECRSAVLAAQTLASEGYGSGTTYNGAATAAQISAVVTLSEVPGTINSITYANNKVTVLYYTAVSGKICKYNGSTFSIETSLPAAQ